MLAVACGKGGDDAPVKGTPVAKVTLNKTSLELYKGDEIKLVAEVTPDDATDKTITWKSDKNEIAEVDDTGKVTAVAEGEAIITATSVNNIKAQCFVTVAAPLTDDKDITAKFDAEFAKSLQAAGLIPDATKIKYADVKAIEKITVTGTKVTSLKGIEFMKALRVLVIDGSSVAEVDLSMNAELEKAMIMNAPATRLDISGCTKLTYLMCTDCKLETLDISNNKLLATCYFDGNPGKDGTFVVSTWKAFVASTQFTTGEWKYGPEKATVVPVFIEKGKQFKPVKAISLGEQTELLLETGESFDIKAVTEPTDATIQKLAWSIDNEKVATFKNIGGLSVTINATAKGTATITAKATDGSGTSAAIKVVVTDKPTGISFDGHSGAEDRVTFLTWFGKEFDLKAKATPAGVPLTAFEWWWRDPNEKNKETHGVDYNITAEKATITCYWTENVARSGIDIKAYISTGSDIMATAGIIFRTVCWLNYKDNTGKLHSDGLFYDIGKWRYTWDCNMNKAMYFVAYCPPLERDDLLLAEMYFPEAYIPTSEYTLTVSADDAKKVKITKEADGKCYKLEPLTTDTTSVELIYTCGKHVQRYKVNMVI